MKFFDVSKQEFELVSDTSFNIITLHTASFDHPNFNWDHSTKVLTVRKGYRWDGLTGAFSNTINTIDASLLHDSLYHAMRLGLMGIDNRLVADNLFRAVLIIAGMSPFKAGFIYRLIRIFGKEYTDIKQYPELVAQKSGLHHTTNPVTDWVSAEVSIDD